MNMAEVHSNSLLVKYKSSIEELQDALIRERKLRQEGERENRSLRKHCLSLEESLTETKHSNEELYSNYQLSLTQSSDLNEKLQLVGAKLEEAYSYIEERDKLVESLESKLSSHKFDSQEKEALLMRISSLSNELKKTHEDLKAKDTAMHEWASTITAIESQLQSLQTENAKINQNISDLTDENEKLTQDKSKVEEMLNAVYSNLNDLNAKHQVTKKQKTELEILLNNQVKEIEDNLALNENNYRDIVHQKDHSISQLETQLSNAHFKLEKTMKQLVETRDSEEQYLLLSRRLQEQVEENNKVIQTLNLRTQEEINQVKQSYEERLTKMLVENKEEFENQLSQYKVELDEEVVRGEQCYDSFQLQALQLKEQYMKQLIDKEEELQVLNDDRRRLQEVMKEMQTHLEKLQLEIDKKNNDAGKHLAKDKIQFWKCKFTEEIGYMKRWAEDLSEENDEHTHRLQAIIERLTTLVSS